MKMNEYGRIVIINGMRFDWPRQIGEIRRLLSFNNRPIASLYVHGENILHITAGNGLTHVDDAIKTLEAAYEKYLIRAIDFNRI